VPERHNLPPHSVDKSTLSISVASFVYFAFLLLLPLVLPSALLAEASALLAEEGEVSSKTGNAAESPEEEKTTVVPALGEWLRPEPVPTPEADLLEGEEPEDDRPDFRREDAQEKKIFQELLRRSKGRAVDVPITPPLVKDVILTRAQKKRIKKLQRRQRARIWTSTRPFRQYTKFDARGLPEVRICSLNLQNYSTRIEVRRVTKDTNLLKKHRRKEREIIKAVTSEACTVVAVQGLVGTSLKRAKEGLKALAEKISKKSDFSWRAFVGASNHRLAFNGFLVSDYNIEVVTLRYLVNEQLPQFGDFKEELFYRGPVELVLKVNSPEGNGSRKIVLYTFNWRKLLDEASSEAEHARMQMAEKLRSHIVKRSRRMREKPRPIIVALGDREAGRFAPATRILEGSLRLRDFLERGNCRLERVETEVKAKGKKKKKKRKKKRKKKTKVEHAAVCEELSPRVKLLFGVVGEQLPKPPNVVVKEVDGEKTFLVRKDEKRAQRKRTILSRERTAEIYLFQGDLPAAFENSQVSGRYAMTTRELKHLRKKSPLLRIDLNW